MSRVIVLPVTVFALTCTVYVLPLATVTGARREIVQSTPSFALGPEVPTRRVPCITRTLVPTVVPMPLFEQNWRRYTVSAGFREPPLTVTLAFIASSGRTAAANFERAGLGDPLDR